MQMVQIDTDKEIEITPVFKYIEVEDVPQSEIAGHAVFKQREVVEIRFAGSRNYSPIFPADAMYRREGLKVITYAERWERQYNAFKNGDQQEADGTPLNMLATYGVTPEMLSLCRVRKIYSVEALHSMEGDRLKSLGMHQNKLKEAARKFLADRGSNAVAQEEIADLRAQLAEMKQLLSTAVPAKEPTQEEAEKVAIETGAYGDLTDAEIKERIKLATGEAPRGNPKRETLEMMLSQAEAA
jgi:hypothetical protein